MQITFLIGNGYDVGVGMKSRFKDFFPIYRESSKDKDKRIKQLSDEIEKDYENNYKTWADFEYKLGQYTTEFDMTTKRNFIDQIRDFQSEFIVYLKEQERKLSYKNAQYISSKMINGLSQCYTTNNLAPESTVRIKGIYTKHAGDNHVYNFVNFNYTDVLSNCLETIPDGIVKQRKYGSSDRTDKIGRIVHVHGKNDLYPIIGVNDASQIANQDLAKDKRFVESIVKPSMNQLLGYGNDTNAANLINDSTIICIYGMALGVTDQKWWDLLIRWLSNSSERQLIIFDYDNKYSTTTPFGWLDKVNGILDKFSQFNTNKSINVEDFRSRIHIAVHKNVFQMDLTAKDDGENGTLMDRIAAIEKETKLVAEHKELIAYMNEHAEELAMIQKEAEMVASLKK